MDEIFETGSVIRAERLSKRHKGFELSIPRLQVPKGFVTTLIGENGAGKSTLLKLLAGISPDFKGEVAYFDGEEKISDDGVKEKIGYAGLYGYFRPRWTVKQVTELSGMLFEHFHEDRFWEICRRLHFCHGGAKEARYLSGGDYMKLMLAAVLARDTELLILDEPASSLDPLVRDSFCDMLREYMEGGDGERSVLFSTHNIADVENVTDYILILKHGNIVEQGFVEDLKEKYVLVKGEAADAEAAGKVLFSMTGGSHGFEGICLAEELHKLAGLDISRETPSLYQISVAVMKNHI